MYKIAEYKYKKCYGHILKYNVLISDILQPAEELASSLTEIVKEVIDEREKQARKQSALQRQVEESNIFQSSAIKYVVKQVTPFSKR